MTQAEWERRSAEWERLIGLLEEADAVQQTLLGDSDPEACYEFHLAITGLADELEGYAQAEEETVE